MIFAFGSAPRLRPMARGDLGAVLRIISGDNTADFEAAREALRDDCEGMFVLTERGRVVGVTGAEVDPFSDDIVWLSWTFADRGREADHLERTMFEALTALLRADGVRKLFVNFREPGYESSHVSLSARALLAQAGARLEATLPDYHADGEAQVTYGFDLTDGPVDRSAQPSSGALRFVDIEDLPESDGGLGLVWEEVEGTTDPATIDPGLDRWVGEARRRAARILVAAVPSDLCANLNGPLSVAGFRHHGRLLDYFSPNIHQELGSLRLR